MHFKTFCLVLLREKLFTISMERVGETLNILITGSSGFVGRNLVENLKNIRDGKNRIRPGLNIEEIYEFDMDSDESALDEYCRTCDFVFNLAGVNRPKEQTEFMTGNFGFASRLLASLKASRNTCPVMLSSSIQASLTGRFTHSAYGQSKLAGERLFFDYAKETGAKVLVYRFPNLFGKWCRPHYNSAVATFCHAVANDEPYTVNDRNTELTLLYIDDLVEELLDALEGKEHRCRYHKTNRANGESNININGVSSANGTSDTDGINGITDTNRMKGTNRSNRMKHLYGAGQEPEPIPDSQGPYCYVPTTHHATLGEIVDLLESFKQTPDTLLLPEMPPDSFAKKLYSTWLSYLPEEKIAYVLSSNMDERGSFTELIKTINCGQISVNITKPGVTKGQHWHNSKWEIFIVVSGRGLIQERKIGTDPLTGGPYSVHTFEVTGERMQAVRMLPGYTHSIMNLSDTENLVTVMWANEIFDPSHPDTFYEMVK